jgi:hypothetical protein
MQKLNQKFHQSDLMKNVLHKTTLLLLLIAGSLLSERARAQCTFDSNGRLIDVAGQPCVNTIVSAVPFLRITPDARSGAMGDAGIAISPDANAMHFNASKLAFAESDFAISATYTPWLRALGLNDVYLAYLSGYRKLDDMQALGFSLRYFSLGSIQFTDENAQPLNTGRPHEFEVAAAYSRKLAERFSAAITGKFIFSNLAAGQTVPGGETIEIGLAGAADVSFTYNAPVNLGNSQSDLMVGLAFTNIGSKISYTRSTVKDFLPANFGLGAAWNIDFDQYNRITFTGDVNKLMVPTPCHGPNCDLSGSGVPDWKEKSPIAALFSSWADAPEGFSEELRELMFSFGAEYWYDRQFAVRAGYYTEHARKGARKYLTVGLGLKYNIFGLNFSYLVPTTNLRNPLDNTLRFSLLFDFGAAADGN